MPTSIATIEIDAPACEVFRHLTTPNLLTGWIGGLVSYRPIGGGSDLRLGARSREKAVSGDREVDVESEIMGFEPDRSLNVRIDSSGFHVLADFHLFESDGRTVVRESVQFEYKKWHRLFAPITNRSVQRKIEKDLKRLKERVEAGESRAALRKTA